MHKSLSSQNGWSLGLYAPKTASGAVRHAWGSKVAVPGIGKSCYSFGLFLCDLDQMAMI